MIMRIKIFFISLVFLLFYTSCSKDKGCNGTTVEYANIPQSNKDLIPYKGGETLTFLHVNTGDTVTFIGESKWTSYSNSSFGGADCVIETRREGRGIAFFDKISNKTIVINQRNTSGYTSTFELDFEGEYFITGAYDFSTGRTKFDYDSLNIQNNTYNKIFKFNNDAYPRPTNYFVFCNSKYGILKFELSTGEIWELISKK
jgi:hypothetical protein